MGLSGKKTVKRNACGKEVPAFEVRHLRLKTCCSHWQVSDREPLTKLVV